MPYKDLEKRKEYQKRNFHEWYLRNKERKNAQSRAWRENHLERAREIDRESYRRRRQIGLI